MPRISAHMVVCQTILLQLEVGDSLRFFFGIKGKHKLLSRFIMASLQTLSPIRQIHKNNDAEYLENFVLMGPKFYQNVIKIIKKYLKGQNLIQKNGSTTI